MPRQTAQACNYDGISFLRMLRSCASWPLALSLALLFLVSNAAFGFADLHVDHRSDRAQQSNLYACDDNHDLATVPAENREIRSGRETQENSCFPKLDLKFPHAQFSFVSCPVILLSFSPRLTPLLSLTSACKTPFSPRPPPVSPCLG
jgi:hypothetical protein